MLKNRKKLHTAQRKNSLVHQPKIYKTKSQKKFKLQSKKLFSLFLSRSLYIFIGIVTVLTLVFAFVRIYSYKKALNKNISNAGFECREYANNPVIQSVLKVKKDNLGNPEDFKLYIYSGDKSVLLNLNEVVLPIDKNGKQGTLSDYFDQNETYLESNRLLKNLPNVLISNLYIKIDHLIIENGYDFDTYLVQKNKPAFAKLLSQKSVKEEERISTDICIKSWSEFTSDFSEHFNKNTPILNYNNFKITSGFALSEIKKEQIRVQIVNQSGVESLSNFYQLLFENYGVNIVKNDNSNEIIPSTKLSVDESKSAAENTTKYLIYILEKSINLEKAPNLFADVTVYLGQDAVINY